MIVAKFLQIEENINNLRTEYETFLTSKDKSNFQKQESFVNKLNKLENNFNQSLESTKLVNVTASQVIDRNQTNEMKTSIQHLINKHVTPRLKSSACIQFDIDTTYNVVLISSPLVMNHIKWHLSVSGGNFNAITNNGKTFYSREIRLARSNQPMLPGSGVYKIRWQVQSHGSDDMIGICTNNYQNGSGVSISGSKWYQSNYYMGWSIGNNEYRWDSGILWGWNKQKSNIFYQNAQFIGDTLPTLSSTQNMIGLIYDSNNNTLFFEFGQDLLNGKVIDLPSDKPLFWCIGKYGSILNATIVDDYGCKL